MEYSKSTNFMKLILLFFFLTTTAIFCQEITIKGTVKSYDGVTLPGVSVLQKGTTNGSSTNFGGEFEIKLISGDKILVFSSLGYKTKEIVIGKVTALNIILEDSSEQLDEIVVVGYGSEKRSNLVGSVGSVKGKDLNITPVPTVDLALQGKIAGLQITNTSAEPGGQATIRIRGNNSILGDNAPLIVIDGYPMPVDTEASTAGAGDGNQTGSNILSYLDPSEIESVQILKDASATAIYGSRGANGVIMITTKKGKYLQKTRISLNSELGINEIDGFPIFVDGPTYAQWRNDIAISQGLKPSYLGDELPLPEDVVGTDWVKRIIRTGFNRKYSLSISGGGTTSRYFLASSFIQNEGILIGTDFSRGNIRLNLNNNLTDRLSVATSVNYVLSKSNRSGEGSGAIANSGAIFRAYSNNPAASPSDPIDQGDGLNNFFNDPLRELEDTTNETYQQTLILSFLTKYSISEGFDFNITTGTTSVNSRRELFFPRTTRLGDLFDSRAVINTRETKNYLIEPYFSYRKKFNNQHNLNTTLGLSSQVNDTRLLNTRVENFPVDVLGTGNIGLGLNPAIPVSARIKRVLQSYYLRLNYNFKQKYFFSFTGRADGSSVFAENKKWGFFPSIGAGWTISNESFMNNFKMLSNLKLRTSYGITGSQSIQPFQSLSLLSVANSTFENNLYSGLSPGRFGNPDLEWEKTSQYNIGLDVGFLKNRFSLSLDYYNKRTNDLLLNFPLPSSAGLPFIVDNAGSVENRGFEVTLDAKIIENNKFHWKSNFNWSNNRTKVLSLGDTNADIFGPGPATNIVNQPSNVMRVGQPFSALYGYKISGVLQESDFDSNGNSLVPVLGSQRAGQYKFVDIDGDGSITARDQDIIGDPNPDFIFGWTNEFRYKRLNLSIFFQGSIGNDLMNIDRLFFASGRFQNNVYQDWFTNRWTPNNPTNNPRYADNGNQQAMLQPNSAAVEDGSYIRLRNVSLGYMINTNKIDQIKAMRVYFTGTNLFTITNYSGSDPEVNIRGGNNLAQGIDFASYPRARTFTLGVSMQF